MKNIIKMFHDLKLGNKFLQKTSQPEVTKFKTNKPWVWSQIEGLLYNKEKSEQTGGTKEK